MTTAHRFVAPRGLDDLFLYRLSRLVQVAGAPVIRLCEGRHGITRREWRLIAALAEQGAQLSSELAARVHLDRARTSKAISILVDKKLATRTPRPHDRRQIEVALTPAGRAIYDALFPEVVRLNQVLLADIERADLERLDAFIDMLQGRAEAWLAEAELPKADRARRARARD